MKKMFKVFGIALLACSLLTVACQKDEDTSSTTTTNNSGTNGGGTNPTPNPNPNPNPNPQPQPQPTSSIQFEWDGQVQELKAVNISYQSNQDDVYYIDINASGDAHQSGDQQLVDLPSYQIVFSYVGAGYVGAHDLAFDEQYISVFSTEVMSDDAHTQMFTTRGSDNIYTLTNPDFVYVSHTEQNVSYNVENHTFSGTVNIVLKSVYDEATSVSPIRQKTLKVTVQNYPVTVSAKGMDATKKVRK